MNPYRVATYGLCYKDSVRLSQSCQLDLTKLKRQTAEQAARPFVTRQLYFSEKFDADNR